MKMGRWQKRGGKWMDIQEIHSTNPELDLRKGGLKDGQSGSESRKKKVDKKKKVDNDLLEESITILPAAEQREFLWRHGKPSWGINGLMANIILEFGYQCRLDVYMYTC